MLSLHELVVCHESPFAGECAISSRAIGAMEIAMIRRLYGDVAGLHECVTEESRQHIGNRLRSLSAQECVHMGFASQQTSGERELRSKLRRRVKLKEV